MMAAYPKHRWTAVVPVAPSSARLMTFTPYCFAGSGRACRYGSSSWTMSAPAANRSLTSSATASAYPRATDSALP
jgi:hypothetical protein